MRFGTFHLIGAPEMQPGQQRIGETVDQIVLADQLGLHQVWVAEHHFSNYGYATNPLLIIAKAAGLTRRIRFGQAIIVTPFWHPRLAEDVALTDILTDGRLDVGIGRGYQKLEFDGLGLDIEDSRSTFLEQVEIMTRAWTEDDFTFQGQHFTIPRPITVLPKPVQQPYPQVWVACQSDQTVDWTAARGFLPLFSGSPSSREQISGWRERFLAGWRATGHADPAPRTAVQRFVYVCDSEDEARDALWQTRWQRRVADHLKNNRERIVGGRNDAYPPPTESGDEEWWDRLVYGPPERCIAQIQRDADLGFSEFICWFDVGGLPHETVTRSMRRFAAEVMPAFASRPLAVTG